MKIGIIASSNRSFYASGLITALKVSGYMPQCFIVAESSAFVTARRTVQKYGLLYLTRKIFEHFFKIEPRKKDSTFFLKQYATKHNFADWNVRLDKLANKNRVAYIKTPTVNSENIINFIKDNGIELLINASHELYRQPIIGIVPKGIINTHMGLLPEFRGMNALEWSAFFRKDPVITVHRITSGIDTGDILFSEKVTIEPNDTLEVMREKYSMLSISALVKAVGMLDEGKACKPQQMKKGKQYFVMHKRLRTIAEKRFQEIKKVNTNNILQVEPIEVRV